MSGLAAMLGLAPVVPLGGTYQGRWQDRYAVPDWQSKLTRLSPDDELAFRAWVAKTGAPVTPDYDMRGYWKAGAAGTATNANDGLQHYPDTYKTPLHQSFSGESIYADPNSKPPAWNDKDQLVTPDGKIIYDERAANRRRR